MKTDSKLYGKTVLWNGDSICAGSSVTGAWADRIAVKYATVYKNYAVGGGTVAEGLPPMRSGKARHSVSQTIDRMYEEMPQADYVIIEGGTNDADLLGLALNGNSAARLGAFVPTSFDGPYDRTTFCGALESVFERVTRYWTGKKVGFVVAQKMIGGSTDTFLNRRLYFDHAVGICKKWGIPYLDLWNGCELDPRCPDMYDRTRTPEENKTQNIGFYVDGQHLTARGYDLTAELIGAWLETL